MKIRLCTDEQAWNCAALRLAAPIYHSWERGELAQADGWAPWRIVAEQNGSPVAVVHLLQKRLPFSSESIFYGVRGITGDQSDPQAVQEIAAWLRNLMRRERGFLLRTDPEFPDTDPREKGTLIYAGFSNIPDQWSFWNLSRSTMILDISRPAEEILQGMRKTHRRLIRKAERDRMEIEQGVTPAHLRDFYGLVAKSSERQGFAIRGIEHFERVREIFLLNGKGTLFIARKQGKPAASSLALAFGSTCLYLHGGFDPEVRMQGAAETLHWRVIQWAKSRGCTRYDLQGSGTKYPPQEGNRGFGLYHFKKGLGAELIYSAGYFELVRGSVRYAMLRFLEQNPTVIDAALKLRSMLRPKSRHAGRR